MYVEREKNLIMENEKKYISKSSEYFCPGTNINRRGRIESGIRVKIIKDHRVVVESSC